MTGKVIHYVCPLSQEEGHKTNFNPVAPWPRREKASYIKPTQTFYVLNDVTWDIVEQKYGATITFIMAVTGKQKIKLV